MPDQPPSPVRRTPAVGQAVAPAALLMAVAGLAYLGMAEIGGGHGAFARNVYEPYYDPASIPKESGEVDWFGDGRIVYANNCAACHQANGAGNPANGCPPLAGADWVLAEGPNRLVRLVLHGAAGPITVNGQPWNGVMPPWKDTLTDDQIAAVLTYIRAEWGNTAAPVTPEQVAPIREMESARGAPWTAAELLKIPEQD
ncbi:MAG: c-type cytochrome [Limisphaerales bacterium]